MSSADNEKRLGSNKEYRDWVKATHPEHFGNVEKVFSAPNIGAKEDFAAVTNPQIEFKAGDVVEYKGHKYTLKEQISSYYPLYFLNFRGDIRMFTKNGEYPVGGGVELTLVSKSTKSVTKTPESVTGLKYDDNKPKISLIPREALLEMATALTYGAKKYSADNFKAGIKYRRLLDAALRHILAVADGEDTDESGNSHLSHALASLAMLAYMMKNKPEFDDRYRKDQP